MIKKIIKNYLPDYKIIKENKSLRCVGQYLHNPNLWTLNRYSVATSVSVGLFSALLPLPAQTLIAAVIAIVSKANLPISVGLVWISNPLTTPFIAYFCYKIGTKILKMPEHSFKMQFSVEWIVEKFHSIGAPFLVGSLVLAIVSALLGNMVIRIIWRVSTQLAWKKRQKRRAQGAQL